MNPNLDIDIFQFTEQVKKRGKLPNSAKARCELLAGELAEGLSYGFWTTQITMPERARLLDRSLSPSQKSFLEYYFSERWDAHPPDFSFLQMYGFLGTSNVEGQYTITPAALSLMDRQLRSAIKVFISYKRDESSVFALLLHEKLSQAGIDIFLDMESLQYGENWKIAIERNIRDRKYFLLLLGKSTLNSEMIKQEIIWALKYKLTVLPIWHNGFRYVANPEHKIPPTLKNLLTDTHTMVIEKENPSQYATIMRNLLAYFDIAMETRAET